jgi:hypothetical protein
MPSNVTLDVDLYCTHQDLQDELGSARALVRITSPDDPDTALVRAQALRDVVKFLERRTPPIVEGQLSDLTELKDVVCYGALARLYRNAMTEDGDVYSVLWREFDDKFASELGSLRLTLEGTVSADVPPTTVFRR